MTRETKIGLLVGLAFIIVIGILLSDYNRNETPTAALPLVAESMKNSTATLHNGSSQNEVVLPPAPPTPSRTVMTQGELHQETQVEIGPGGPGPVVSNNGNDQPPTVDTPPTPGPVARNNTPTGNDARLSLPLVETYDPVPPVGPAPVPPTPGPEARDTVNGATPYIAKETDTVSKLAGRFLGQNTKANREAIIALNPSLKANPNNIIVGRTYMIPPAKTAAPVAAAPTPPIHPVAEAPAPAPAPTETPQHYYTVKENDSLWKIAAEQLGDGSAWAAIKELNKDVLKGGEAVRPNMRLRLPAKPVASAN